MSDDGPRRTWVIGLAALLTLAGLAFAFWLGSWAFDVRRYSQHVGRLERLQQKEPLLDQVVQGLEEEGTPLLAAADTRAEAERLAAQYGGALRAEVAEKGARWPHVRVFRAADMLYVLYFDDGRIMRGFTCISR
jgi:hypothetical protein